MSLSFVRDFFINIVNFFLLRNKESDFNFIISNKIKANEPLMIARFGAVEIKCIIYCLLPFYLRFVLRDYVYKRMPLNAGFFPPSEKNFFLFSDLMLKDAELCDVLASWRPEEWIIRKRLVYSVKIDFEGLDPHPNLSNSWTKSLKGKKVLVIHPFSETIKKQYFEKRDKIFPGTDFLPEFKSLTVIKAVQSISGNRTAFPTWFDALHFMESKIDEQDFDIALIGCGAYGFPLSAYVKRHGKQAIHLGGVLQLYFGIKGKRWDDWNIYNEYWVNPSEEETPKGFLSVENGCYW